MYVVSLSESAYSVPATPSPAPLNSAALSELVAASSELTIDGAAGTTENLRGRLSDFWLADEVVVYIGLASRSLRKRVGEYYRTPLGARSPHAGGWWLKTLSVISELSVFCAPMPDYRTAEKAMLRAFADEVSGESRASLHDERRIAPFANLRTGEDTIKRHGLRGATG